MKKFRIGHGRSPALGLAQHKKPERPQWQAPPNAKGRPSIDVGPLPFCEPQPVKLAEPNAICIAEMRQARISRLPQVFLLPRVLESASRPDKEKPPIARTGGKLDREASTRIKEVTLERIPMAGIVC
ncbi:MAG TPA: hypothetical protein VMQ73_01250 [Methylomirabilota bacterium]|nr:hypothetical protein [Methylomirabilota bacterium]